MVTVVFIFMFSPRVLRQCQRCYALAEIFESSRKCRFPENPPRLTDARVRLEELLPAR
jgi:hypothetical protein